jgi:hypothetical protein
MMTTPTRVSIVAALLLCLGPTSVLAADDFIGAIWEVKSRNPKTGEIESLGVIRCTTDGKVYLDGKVVGTHKKTGRDTEEINVTDSPRKPKMKGTWKVARVTKDGAHWEGVIETSRGTISIRLVLKKD